MSEPSRRPTADADEAVASVSDWGSTLAVHQRWLRRVVASRLGEPQAVEEVMQDVALAAVSQRSPLRDPARAAVWLYRLAVRHVLIYRRRSGRRRGLINRYAARQDRPGADGSASPIAWLVREERKELVRDALRRLPPRDAELLVLKYAEGLTSRELSERLGVTVTTIEARLHRARGRLRAELAILATDFEESDHE
jgi:RNA polymerase sigma-70 factor (ECF subfamily)